MNEACPAGLPRRMVFWASGVGVAAGVAYTFSPLAVWFVLAMSLLLRWAVADLQGVERTRILVLLVVALVARVAVVAGLFVVTDAETLPFGHFFGDEEYFIRRSMWLRNVAIGLPIHGADLIYAFDEYSYTHYLYVMALVQAVFGFAPYGLHLVGIGLSMAGVVLLYKAVRPSFGPLVSATGLAVLLVMPTLFAWSVSALKEPPYNALGAAALALTLVMVRAADRFRRVSAAVLLVACAAGLQAIRDGGLVIALISIGGGLMAAWLTARPLRLILAALIVPAVAVVLLTRPEIQMRALAVVNRAAMMHWGHINTPGYTYKSLDPRVYEERANTQHMNAGEIGRYVVRSAVNYVAVPLPWRIESRAMLAAVPELVAWYVMVLLAPIGLAAGLRRDRLLTCLLAASVCGGAVLVAITGGNIGTLIRHRSLVMPFLAWLSALGGWTVLAWLLRAPRTSWRPHRVMAAAER
jgi:hypothetical protein